jgi:hypothetical protein
MFDDNKEGNKVYAVANCILDTIFKQFKWFLLGSCMITMSAVLLFIICYMARFLFLDATCLKDEACNSVIDRMKHTIVGMSGWIYIAISKMWAYYVSKDKAS